MMKRIAVWIVVLVLISAIKIQAAEEESTMVETTEGSSVKEEVVAPKGLQEMWQEVKNAVEKVKETKMMIEKLENDLAKAKKKDVEMLQNTLKIHQDNLKKEVENLCVAIDEFGRVWTQTQKAEEPEETEETKEEGIEEEPTGEEK